MYEYEYTDTFAGEANYAWVHRGTVEAPNDRTAVRRAKAAVGLTGVRCRREEWGGTVIALYPVGSCTVLFVTWGE